MSSYQSASTQTLRVIGLANQYKDLQKVFLSVLIRSNNIPQRSLKTYICIGLTIFFIYNFSKYDIKIRATYLAKQFHEFFAQCAHSIQFRAQFSNLNQYRKLQNNEARNFSTSRNFFCETNVHTKQKIREIVQLNRSREFFYFSNFKKIVKLR